MTGRMDTSVVRSIPLSIEEDSILRRVSAVEHLDEEALLQKFVRDGLARYRLEHAIRAYARGEVNLSQAARYADISVEEMMDEMATRGVYINTSVEQFLDGLETLADLFGSSEELRQVIAEMRQEEASPG